MKHVRFVLIAVMAVCFSFVANAQKAKGKTKTSQKATTTYQCPMKCEGEKTYAKAGDCPVCGMHLKAVAKPVAYQCPMQCEGAKTYAKPGKCPVCNMNLKEQPTKGKKKKEEDHTNHSHNHS